MEVGAKVQWLEGLQPGLRASYYLSVVGTV